MRFVFEIFCLIAALMWIITGLYSDLITENCTRASICWAFAAAAMIGAYILKPRGERK